MADDKRLQIVGEVKIDESQARAGLDELKAELAGFKAGLDRLYTGIDLVLRSLASIAKEMQSAKTGASEAATAATSQATQTAAAAKSAKDLGKATETAAEATQDLGKSTTTAAAATENVTAATEEAAAAAADNSSFWRECVDEIKGGIQGGLEDMNVDLKTVNGRTEILIGIFRRVGHVIIDSVVSAVRGLIGYLASLTDAANEFDVIFDRMAARGVEGVDKMRVAVVELAGALGEDLVDVAKSVDLAESLGAGENAVDTARAAWESYRVTGMDVNRQIEISSRLVRGFNMDMRDQADVIMQVANAAQQARVDQGMMWNGLSSIGPRVKKLGGSFRDLMTITQAGIGGGIKVEEEGLQGLSEALNQLLKPTKEFGEALVETGVVVTQSSPAWEEMNAQVTAQKAAFEALNAEIDDYKQELSAISLVTSQAERAADKFEELQAKRASGERLNKAERAAYRELRKELAEYNSELSKYDDAGYIVQSYEFKHLSTLEQLRQRIDAAKEAQTDLNLVSQEVQLDAQQMGNSYGKLNAELSGVAARLSGEIPGAIQAAISDGSLAQFVQKLGSMPEALKPLSGEVKTLVSAVSANLGSVATEAGKAGGAIAGVGEQAKQMAASGTSGLARLKQNFATLGTTIIGPVVEAMNSVAQVIMDKLQEPFSDGSTVFSRVATWASNISTAIVQDLNAAVSGNNTLDNVLTTWFELALENVRFLWSMYAQPMVDSLIQSLRSEFPNLENFLTQAFTALGTAAKNAFLNAVGDAVFGGLFANNSLFGNATAQYGEAYYRGQAREMLSRSQASGSNTNNTNNFNIYGATNADDVASKVSQSLSRQERLGYSGSRVR